jgi:hypothetical protein
MNRPISTGCIRTLGAFVLATSLPACAAATVQQHTLPPEVVAAVTGTVAQSIIPVDQLTVLPEHTNTVLSQAPFLIPMLATPLGNAIADGIAQRRVQPLVDLTVDVNFRAQYAGALRGTLSEIGWLKFRSLEQRETAAATVNKHDARLQTTTSLILSAKSSVLFVQSALVFYPAGAAEDAPGAEAQILYRSEEVTPKRGAMAVARWAQNSGQAYRSSLAEGVAESMKMTTMAIEHMAGTRYSGKAEALLVWTAGEPEGGGISASEPDAIRGTVVEETANRLILQDGKGGFISLPKSAIGSRDVIGTTPGVAWHAPTPTLAPRAPRPAPTPAAIPEPPPAPAPPAVPAGSPE